MSQEQTTSTSDNVSEFLQNFEDDRKNKEQLVQSCERTKEELSSGIIDGKTAALKILKEIEDDNKKVIKRCEKSKQIIEDGLKKLDVSLKNMEEIGKWEDIIFDVFHSKWVEDKYVSDQASKTDTRVTERCYSKEEFEFLERKAVTWFKQLTDYSDAYQWERHHGVQYNFVGNPKVYGDLLKLAEDSNYVTDFLIFDYLQMAQYEDCSYKTKAKEMYLSVDDPSIFPFNYVYRAILFDEYDDLVKDNKDPFMTCYEWNIPPVEIIDQVKPANELVEMQIWLIKTSVESYIKLYKTV